GVLLIVLWIEREKNGCLQFVQALEELRSTARRAKLRREFQPLVREVEAVALIAPTCIKVQKSGKQEIRLESNAMEFHINRSIRERLDLGDVLFSYTGNVVFANVAASRRMAAQLNALRGGDSVVNAGALFAMGLIDELSHAMIARYRKEIDPSVLTQALDWFAGKVGPRRVQDVLLAFTEQFPNAAIYHGETTAAKWLAGSTEGLSNREAALEELMLL